MLEAVQFWNEPNSAYYWDEVRDPNFAAFGRMVGGASQAVQRVAPHLRRVLGGLLPADPDFMSKLKRAGALTAMDAVAVHGYPMDWDLWRMDEWPVRIDAIQAIADLPVWVTEAGASSFGADQAQVIGLTHTADLLLHSRAERIYWHSVLDLPPAWEPGSGRKESEGSAYYRYFYLGLVRADGSPKPALQTFAPLAQSMGLSQWFYLNDPRLEEAATHLRELGVKRVRTGIRWVDWVEPDGMTVDKARAWFDRQMAVLADFDVTVALYSTPPSRSEAHALNSVPINPDEFAQFAVEVAERYGKPPA